MQQGMDQGSSQVRSCKIFDLKYYFKKFFLALWKLSAYIRCVNCVSKKVIWIFYRSLPRKYKLTWNAKLINNLPYGSKIKFFIND